MKIRWNNARLFLIVSAFIWPAQAELIPASELLELSLSPSRAYSGKIHLTQWEGKRAYSEDVNILFSPWDGYRREYLTPQGTTDRILLSNGDEEKLYLARQNKVLTGQPIREDAKLMKKKEELGLLFRNYRLEDRGFDTVLGRQARHLELVPLVKGKPKQLYWIDEETTVILESERYLPDGIVASRMRFVRFKPESKVDRSLFEWTPASGAIVDQHGLDPDFLTLDALQKETAASIKLPSKLPGGFIFESADSFDLNSTPVLCVRYTDGLTMLSIFQTTRPVRLTAKTSLSPSKPGGFLDTLGVSQAHQILAWKKGKSHYTLISDLSPDLLRDIQAALPH